MTHVAEAVVATRTEEEEVVGIREVEEVTEEEGEEADMLTVVAEEVTLAAVEAAAVATREEAEVNMRT